MILIFPVLMMIILISWLRWYLPIFSIDDFLNFFVMNMYFVGRYFKVMKINQYQCVNLFIYLFMLIQMHTFKKNLVGYNPLLTLFWYSNKISSNHLMYSFNISPSFFEYFFSSTKGCSGLILRFSCLCSQLTISLGNPGFF